jgi:hypothetical protein
LPEYQGWAGYFVENEKQPGCVLLRTAPEAQPIFLPFPSTAFLWKRSSNKSKNSS